MPADHGANANQVWKFACYCATSSMLLSGTTDGITTLLDASADINLKGGELPNCTGRRCFPALAVRPGVVQLLPDQLGVDRCQRAVASVAPTVYIGNTASSNIRQYFLVRRLFTRPYAWRRQHDSPLETGANIVALGRQAVKFGPHLIDITGPAAVMRMVNFCDDSCQ